MKPLIHTLILFIAFSSVHGQGDYRENLIDTVFKSGIYLENLNTLIPWHFDVADSLKYGKPIVKRLNKRTLLIKWDSVTILNGIIVNFEFQSFKSIFSKEYPKLWTLSGTIKASDFIKLKHFFDKYASPEYLHEDNIGFAAYQFKYCNVRLGINHKYLGNFLLIQRRPSS